jgi:hypothetical protein
MADAKLYSNLFAHPTCYPTDFFYADFNIAWRLRHALGLQGSL